MLVRRIRLFLGAEHPCSYLLGRVANSAYVDTDMNPMLYSRLAEQGFRRSGDLVYRPHCRICTACIPIRVPVRRFWPDRSQRRNLRNNSDLEIIRKAPEFDEDHYRLFRRYLTARHEDGNMANLSPQEYMAFLGSHWADTTFVEFKSREKLLAVAVVDRLDRGLSAVYTFFDPAQAERGLGTQAVLWQIGEARRLGLEWLYLGYWIGDCRKMNYKTRFRPLEALIGEHWKGFRKRGEDSSLIW